MTQITFADTVKYELYRTETDETPTEYPEHLYREAVATYKMLSNIEDAILVKVEIKRTIIKNC